LAAEEAVFGYLAALRYNQHEKRVTIARAIY